ncbi:PAS domain-containing sensor histidine kinase [Candidatus Marinimicrobia bacterium MT.SAG.2]|nr:PAS domain-containing sensor histidine kinase [Candidatus Marinimicrobia bacterium MT.SAG.2]
MINSKNNDEQLMAYADDIAKLYEAEKKKRLEAELESKKLRLTIDAVSEGIVTLDEDKNIIEANKSFAGMVGIDVDSLKSKSLSTVLNGASWKPLTDGLDKIENKDTIQINPDGENRQIYTILRSVVIGKDGERHGWVISFKNETNRKRVELLKDEFFSLLFHEIRTPLNIILGFLGILSEKIISHLDEEEIIYFENVQEGASRLQRTIEDLLEFANLSVNVPSKVEKFDLKESVEEVLISLGEYLAEKEISVVLKADDDNYELLGYKSIMLNALGHLIDNAAKFSPDGSKIKIQIADMDDVYHLEIIDRGKGISPDNIDRVFDRFYQVEQFFTRTVGGLGLGLSIAKKAVSIHGGEISISSKLDEGTTVMLKLPKQKIEKDEDSVGNLSEFEKEIDLLRAQNLQYAKDLAKTFKRRKEVSGKLEKTQDQLVRSDKLATMGQMAAGIAHEVNNMLTPVLASLYMIEKRKDKFEPELAEIIQTANESGKRAVDMLRDILDYSRKGSEDFEEVDVTKILDKTLNLLSFKLKKGRVKLNKKYREKPVIVSANPGQLEQVFTNLCINAIDAMQVNEGGILEIGVDVVDDGGSVKSAKVVQIRFTDDGPGIPEEIKESIFEPFYTTKKEGEGTGLGLFITYGIVEKHGGLIRVDSAVGKGSTFVINLPYKEEQE